MKEAQAAGVRGTPTIFINGKKPQGRSFQLYKGIIDGILNEKGKAGLVGQQPNRSHHKGNRSTDRFPFFSDRPS